MSVFYAITKSNSVMTSSSRRWQHFKCSINSTND